MDTKGVGRQRRNYVLFGLLVVMGLAIIYFVTRNGEHELPIPVGTPIGGGAGWIAFEKWTVNKVEDIYLVRADGTGLHQFITDPNANDPSFLGDGDPEWSPNGEYGDQTKSRARATVCEKCRSMTGLFSLQNAYQNAINAVI